LTDGILNYGKVIKQWPQHQSQSQSQSQNSRKRVNELSHKFRVSSITGRKTLSNSLVLIK
jgi:hypothetical protein